jgi:YqaJ-like viral recombinase domain
LQISFKSSKKLLKELIGEKVEESPAPKRQKHPAQIDVPQLSAKDMQQSLLLLSKICDAAILKFTPPFSEKFRTKIPTPVELPGLFSNFFDKNLLSLNYTEALQDSHKFIQSIELIDPSDVIKIAEFTKSQSKSTAWFEYRAGRVTGSKISSVCNTVAEAPSLSLIKSICHPSKSKLKTPACLYGSIEEKNAVSAYMKQSNPNHNDLEFKEVGLYISSKKTFIASSPDGLVNCSCCGTGVLEVKCPFNFRDKPIAENLSQIKFLEIDEFGVCGLKKSNEYFYQVQNHLYCVREAKYCDFVVYTRIDVLVIRIFPDLEFQTEMVEASENFFVKCLLPELRCWLYTRANEKRTALQSLDQNLPECYCKSSITSNLPTITCSYETCGRIFHLKCVYVEEERIPKTWLCLECMKKPKVKKPKAQKPKVKNPKQIVSSTLTT